MEPGWDQVDRRNGSVLCDKYIVYGKCSRGTCRWEHSSPQPGETRPPCGNLILRGGCGMGQHCKLSHEQLDATDFAGNTQDKTNGLPSGLAKDTQTNGRPTHRPYSEHNSGQPSGAGVSSGAGYDSRMNGHTNYRPSIEGISVVRQDGVRRKDALVVGPRHEGPRTQSVPEPLNFNLRGGGVALGSLSNYDGPPQVKKVLDTHNVQYGYPIRHTPTVERIDKAVGKGHQIDSLPHGPISSHRVNIPSQNGPGIRQTIRHPVFTHRPFRDQTAMNRGSNSGPDLIPRAEPIETGNEVAGITRPGDVKDSWGVQTRVIFYDPTFSYTTEKQGEARLSLGTNISSELLVGTSTEAPRRHEWGGHRSQGEVYRASVSGELPAGTTRTYTEAPRRHEWGGHRNQEEVYRASVSGELPAGTTRTNTEAPRRHEWRGHRNQEEVYRSSVSGELPAGTTRTNTEASRRHEWGGHRNQEEVYRSSVSGELPAGTTRTNTEAPRRHEWGGHRNQEEVYRASVSGELPAGTTHTSTEAPQRHEWGGHRSQEEVYRSSVSGKPPAGTTHTSTEASRRHEWGGHRSQEEVHRASVSGKLPAGTTRTNTEAPRRHEWRRYQNQEGLSHASPRPGDPGGGNGSKQVFRYGVGDGLTRAGLVQGLPEGASSEIRGGGVALNGYPQTDYISEKKNGVLIEASDALAAATIRDSKVETNGSERNVAKNQEYGSQSSPAPSTSKSPRGIGDGGEIQSQLLTALRIIGKMNPKASPFSPESARRVSAGGSLEENRAGHSNLERFTRVSLMGETGFAIEKPIGNGFSDSEIPAESLGNRPAVSQKTSTTRPTETTPRKSRGLGFNGMGGSEGDAKIGDIEYGEHEEGGAKLPVEQNVQLEFNYSQTNAGLGKSNEPVANGAANPLQEITPLQGPRNSDYSSAMYPLRRNSYHSHGLAQGHNRGNSAVKSNDGYRSEIQGTVNPRPEYTHRFGHEIRETAQYQSLRYGHRVTTVPKNATPTGFQLNNRNTPLNTSSVLLPTQEPFRESQSQPESIILNYGRDSAHLRLDRSTRLPQALYSYPTTDLSPLYRPQVLNQPPPALFSYEHSESSFNSQGIQGDAESNRRPYTPEPEELDRSALRLYYDERRVEAKVFDTNWASEPTPPNRQEPAPPNRQEPPMDYNEFIKGDSQDKDIVLVIELKNSEKTPKEISPMPEQSFEKAPSSWEEPPKKERAPTPEQFFMEALPPTKKPVLTPEQPFGGAPPSPKKPASMSEQSFVEVPLSPTKKPVSTPEQPFGGAPPSPKKPASISEQSFAETPLSPTKKHVSMPEQPFEKALPSPKKLTLMPEQSFEKTPPSRKEPPTKHVPTSEQYPIETRSSWKEPPKKPPPMADKSLEKKATSAWERPLVKTTSPKPNRNTCWMCGRYHQRDENEECRADQKVVEAAESKYRRASTVNSRNDWDWQNEWGEQANGWFDGETEKPEPKRSRTKEKPQNRNKNSVGYVNRQSEGETVELAKRNKKRKGRLQGGSTSNGEQERVEAVSEDSPGVPKSDGAKSLMFKADGNHFGKYYEDNLGGVRKLSEDTLHMIFSYVADGLMPEDQMKMKNVHIGSNFRLDASFTSTRYRRLKSVLRSCRYWRHLSQHIVYKYVNLDQFCNFKGFVRTVSEDAELGKMVRAVKINIQGGASYMSHDNRLSKQELSEMPKSSDSAQLFTAMMESCPELQILSANMYGAIRGFNFVLTKFLNMREMQIMDDSSKGMVAHNLWKNLGNYPNLEKFRIFHSEENGATNFDTLRLLPPKELSNKKSTAFVLKALTMERAPELSDQILGVFTSRLKHLTNLVIVDCKLVTSAGLARAIQRMPNPDQLNRLIYYVWVDPFGKATPEEMIFSKDHLCSTIRDYCTNLTYLNWKPYRICGDFWKESNFRILKRCRIEPMVFKDCNKEVELRNHSKFMDAYRQAREEERLPELAEDRVVFDFYF